MKRTGVAAAGNWIIDQVKVIDRFPPEDHLANILSQSEGTGGGAYNVLVGLRALDPDLPLEAVGVVGEDAHGHRILHHCSALEIDARGMRSARGVATSYTDVMTVAGTGRRTFFHNRGANALLCGEDFDFERLGARILHLGYLLLLDELDAPDPGDASRPCAARVLEEARAYGMRTSIDLVSDLSDRIHTVVTPCLRHVDYFIANELETGALTGVELRQADGGLAGAALDVAAGRLFELGVGEVVVIHAPEGGYWRTRSGEEMWQPSVALPQDFIKGTAGAGDAFCSGVLYGLHEEKPADWTLRLAVCHAAKCLSHETTTGGLTSLEESMDLAERFGFRP